jgi:hypothetical protein
VGEHRDSLSTASRRGRGAARGQQPAAWTGGLQHSAVQKRAEPLAGKHGLLLLAWPLDFSMPPKTPAHGKSSRFVGVTRLDSGKWKAQIGISNKHINLGHFAPTPEGEEAAARKYDREAVRVRRLAARGGINWPIEDYVDLLTEEERRRLAGLPGTVSTSACACGTLTAAGLSSRHSQ